MLDGVQDDAARQTMMGSVIVDLLSADPRVEGKQDQLGAAGVAASAIGAFVNQQRGTAP
jgi:hypothetical protein